MTKFTTALKNAYDCLAAIAMCAGVLALWLTFQFVYVQLFAWLF